MFKSPLYIIEEPVCEHLRFPNELIGERSVIGAECIVTSDVLADWIAVGNPCKIIRKNYAILYNHG